MMKRRRAYNTFAILVVLLLIQAPSLGAQTPARVEHVSNHSFDQTVKQLETAIKKRGLMIVATLDHQNMLRMLGTSIRGSKTLEFAKPDMMKTVLPQNPEAALEMPLKLYVYERADGKVGVSYYKPSGGFASYGKEPLAKVGQMMDAMLSEIVAEATK
jgi:uncharacterized protein (DUF302 family)